MSKQGVRAIKMFFGNKDDKRIICVVDSEEGRRKRVYSVGEGKSVSQTLTSRGLLPESAPS